MPSTVECRPTQWRVVQHSGGSPNTVEGQGAQTQWRVATQRRVAQHSGGSWRAKAGAQHSGGPNTVEGQGAQTQWRAAPLAVDPKTKTPPAPLAPVKAHVRITRRTCPHITRRMCPHITRCTCPHSEALVFTLHVRATRCTCPHSEVRVSTHVRITRRMCPHSEVHVSRLHRHPWPSTRCMRPSPA